MVCAVIAWDSQRRRREIADNAQQVVLASVTLDPEGRFLVTSEGLLPSQKVTRQYNQRVCTFYAKESLFLLVRIDGLTIET